MKMQKRDFKNNGIDKKGFVKNRGGKTNYSIKNLQAIDKVPNDNLYKNDNIYTMNKYFEFSSNEEQTYRLFCHYNYQKNRIKIIIILFYIRFLFSRINNLKDLLSFFKLFNFKNIFHIISIFISYVLTDEIYLTQNECKLYLYYLFLFNQSIHINSIYYKLEPKYEQNIEIISELFYNYCVFFFINIKLINTVSTNIIIPLVYINSLKRKIGISFLYYFIYEPVLSLTLYVFFIKTIKEIWALYDSFKRSFYNVNQGLLESDPNPIFIISKDKNILYKNSPASKLVNNILENQNLNSHRKIHRNKEITINFLDLVHPNLKELFQKLLNDVMEDNSVSSFNFPLCKVNNQENLNINVSNAYDIYHEKNYLYFVWYRINICKTEWKNKTAFYMSLLPCEDVLLNEIFYQYTKRFSEKIEKVISNSDIIVDAFINKMEKGQESKSSSSSEVSGSENEDNGEEKEKNNKNGLKKNIYQLLIENKDNVELNNTILFFFKNQVEFLYDYSLTIELYFNMLYKQRNFKFCVENVKPDLKKRIKLKEFTTYYLEYFYDFTKEHKYKLEFKDVDKNIFDIFIEENYLRIILFNIIVFLICYLDDKKEPTLENKKEIIIKIIPELKDETPVTPESVSSLSPNENYQGVKKGELTFIFETFSTNGDLNKIKELINQKNKCGCHIKSEIIKLNFLDVGILSVNYLLENYYKTKLEMSNKEGEQVLQFRLPCDLELLNDSTIIGKNNQQNVAPDSNSFFSPLITAKRHIKKDIAKPKNFYNFNENYNKKVLNIFYGIEKSPRITRHKRANPSFCQVNEINKTNKRFSRHISQHLYNYEINSSIQKSDKNVDSKINVIYVDNGEKKENVENKTVSKKNSKKYLSQFSFKQGDLSFDSAKGSFKSECIENEDISNNEEERINANFNFEIFEENDENEEKKKENKILLNEVLIFNNQNNKEFITFLNNENKGEYTLKVVNDISDIEKETGNNGEKYEYKVYLINMGVSKEIKFAEKICTKKGESLIYGYNFGGHTRVREKNNVKYDKRFDLSLSFEGICFALKQVFIYNHSISNNF